MTVSVMIITHDEVGEALLNAATTTLGELPLATTVVTVKCDTDPEDILPRLQRSGQHIDHGDGLLILTDLVGSTPCNIASTLASCLGENQKIRVVTGINLSMLIRLMNYPHLDLDELAEKAITGGRDGVMQYSEEEHA